MSDVFSYISSNFLESLVLVLLCLLFVREAFVGWINTLLGRGPSPTERRTLQMANQMSELKMHFNDETTHLLTDLQIGQRKLVEKFDNFESTQIQQCGKLDEIRDILRDMSRNGIRIRK